MQVEQFRNHVRCLLVPNAGADEFALCIAFRGGRYEPNQLLGVTHLIDHFVDEECRRFPDTLAFARAADCVHTDFIETGQEALLASFRSRPSKAAESVQLAIDQVLYPRFTKTTLQRIVNPILEEEFENREIPDERLADVLEETVFHGHALGRSIYGRANALRTMTPEMVRRWHATLMHDAVVIVAGGAFDPGEVRPLLERRFGRLMSNPTLKSEPFHVTQSRLRLRMITWPDERVQVGVGFPIPFGFGDRRRLLLSLINNHLGSPIRKSARLRQRLRVGEGLVYQADSQLWNYGQEGDLTVITSCRPESVVSVLRIIAEELRLLRDKPLSEEDLTSAYESLDHHAQLRDTRPLKLAGFLAEQVLVTGMPVSSTSYQRRLHRITASSRVQYMARRILRQETMNVVLAGRVQSLDRRKVVAALQMQ
ncbi:MAG: insulinase family protein [Candidatus Kerfeldbacteria bacterium]|nr:insulinase family protein [Candidatus Kerfeldbacteria bacterium]